MSPPADTTAVLGALRALMAATNVQLPDGSAASGLDAYMVPLADAHQSEYIADWDGRLQFVTGFSGSRGVAVLTDSEAAMWTDSRYFLQAREEMDDNWTLMREGVEGTPRVSQYMCSNLTDGSIVGVNPTLVSADNFDELSKKLKACGQFLVPVKGGLVDKVWTEHGTKPPVELKPIFPLEMKYTGKTMWEKIGEVREKMAEEHCSLLVLADLFEIAWLFNLRGDDIPYNPVFFAFAIVGENTVSLFTDETQMTGKVLEHLVNCSLISQQSTSQDATCLIYPYGMFQSVIEGMASARSWLKNARTWLPKDSTNYATASLFPEDARHTETSPVAKLKAVKNTVELDGMKLSHVKDGVAECQFLHWLYGTMADENAARPTEIGVADKLEEYRRQDESLVGLSFPTISAVGGHASKPHYSTGAASDVPLNATQCYLVDSGGQYIHGGTTDVTRTVTFTDDHTAFYKECYTRVVMSHIDVARQVFPAAYMTGSRLDTIARKLLWDVGLDFGHGTGHGMGSFLSVHEGPHSISYRGDHAQKEELKEGMILTIEPGYYEDNEFGIRFENAYVIVPVNHTKYHMADVRFMQFEPLTLAPVETRHLMKEMMSPEQIAWLDDYHADVLRVVGAELEQMGKYDVAGWLKGQCEPL